MTASDLATWQESNDAYLSAAIEWLRLLLQRHTTMPMQNAALGKALPHGHATAAAASDADAHPMWWRFRRTRVRASPPEPETNAPPLLLPSPSFEVSEASVNDAYERLRAAEGIDPPPALRVLANAFNLSQFERDVLLLAVAMELDTRIAGLCAEAQDDASLPFPTFGLAFALFDAPAWDARSPENPLRHWRLLELNRPWTHPLTSTALRADERIVNFAKGLNHLDDRIAPFVTPLGPANATDELPASQQGVADEIVGALERDQPQLRPIQLLGPDSASKQAVARAAARRLGANLYRMPAELLPAQPADLDTLVRLWQRETLLMPVALYLEASDVDRSADAHATPLRRFLMHVGGVVFVEARETWPVPQGSRSFDVDKPTAAEQRGLWTTTLGEGRESEAAQLASQFSLSLPAIARIGADALADEDARPLRDRIWTRAARHTRLTADALAQRVDAKATWEDLVLPASEVVLLRQIAAHVDGRGRVYDDWGFRQRMNRGLGISALFAGESGTGKTMAAEVIANELNLSLHRIDLSSIVSKWVGETEKNLQQLFNAAEDSSSILFFDEADALFGQRTEVQQSQDRFSNIEINFLLQRIEAYRGLAILATNMKSAIDPGFYRRLRFVVNFAFPGPEERRAMWQRAFPAQVPTEGLDFDRLARLPLTGGSIHNVALSAAFLAAKRGPPVTMPIVLDAARTELRKIGKPVHEADFKWSDKVVELTR
jgi:DNA polymerase III delta prime subunit